MKRKILALGIISLFVFGGIITTAVGEPTASPSGPMQKLFNRVCDMFGWCRGTGIDLEEITGELIYDSENFYIGEAELHFGPNWYIESAESAIDYDGDGDLEFIIDELQGLVGTIVTVEAHEQSENWYSVFTINGETYREPGVPIWAGLHTWRWRHNQPDE